MKKLLTISLLIAGVSVAGENQFNPPCSNERFDAISYHIEIAKRAIRRLEDRIDYGIGSEYDRKSNEYKVFLNALTASKCAVNKLKVVENCLYIPNLTDQQRAELCKQVSELKSDYNRIQQVLTKRNFIQTGVSLAQLMVPFVVHPLVGIGTFGWYNIIKPYFRDAHDVGLSANDRLIKYELPKVDFRMQNINARHDQLIQINRK